LDTDTGTSIVSSIIFAIEELNNKKKTKINFKNIFKNLLYHKKSCLPEICLIYNSDMGGMGM
jgi:hypothetical protein